MSNQRQNSRRPAKRAGRLATPRGTRQSAPVATSRRVTTRKPNVNANSTSATISHREYVGDISGSVLFNSSGFALNPGNSAVFPWLSSIARNYESYVFKQLHFHYETSVSTTTAGTVMLAVDYDASDDAPSSKQALMGYAQAQRSAPWQECAFNCRAGDLHKFSSERYVRDDVPPVGDIKTYDVGNLFLATQGNASDAVLGELYVSYVVELKTPQIHQTLIVAPVLRTLVVRSGTDNTSMFGGNPTYSTSPFTPTTSATGFDLTGLTIGATYCVSFGAYGTGMSGASQTVTGLTIQNQDGINLTFTAYNTAGTYSSSTKYYTAAATTLSVVPDTITGVYTQSRWTISEYVNP